MIHDICNAGIVPYADHTFTHVWVQRRMWIWVYLIFQEVVGKLVILGIDRLDFELAHSPNESFGAVEHIFVYGEAVEGEFIPCVAILMDNFHLLDYG